MTQYGASFAAVYDSLMAEDFDYAAWANYYLELLASAGVRPGYLVECGCGTASLGIQLAQRGIRVLGVDQSPDMLEIAARHAREAGVPLTLVRQDIALLQLGRRRTHPGHLRHRKLPRVRARGFRFLPLRARGAQARRRVGV